MPEEMWVAMAQSNAAKPGGAFPCQVCAGTDYGAYTQDAQGDFVRCLGCGLIVRVEGAGGAPPADDPESQERYYDMYQRRRAHKVWSDARRLEALLHYVRPARGGPVEHLDIGCGLGSMLEAGAVRHGLNSTGVDITPFAVEFCRRQGLAAGPGSITDLGHEDQRFDLVTAMNVLEHIPRTEDGLVEIHRVLRPGGVLGFIVPNGAYLKAHLTRSSHRNYHGKRARHHLTYHTRGTISRLVERTGFEPLPYPWLVSTRMSSPPGAMGEAAICVPRALARLLLRGLGMERELFVIARRL